jgi:nucleoid-associated protein YgaU
MPPEVAISASEQARPEERPREEHRAKESEAHKPTFVMPTAPPPADGPQMPDNLGGWDARPKEHHEEKAARAAEPSLVAADPPATPAVAGHERREEKERERVEHAHSEPPAAVAEDRYAVPAMPPAGADQGHSRSMVVQVSDGDAPDGPPRRLDGRAQEGRANALDKHADYATERGNPATRPHGEAEASDDRRPRAAESHPREFEAAGQPAAARDPRYGYDPVAPAPPSELGPPSYPGPEAGYAHEHSPRNAEMQTSFTQTPLRNDGLYEVQPNDSYWTISERVYGSGAYFRALAEVNRGKAARPDRLPPGLLISTPPVAQLEKDYPDFCPRPNRRETVRNRAAGAASLAAYSGTGRTYVVQEGDSLTSIARNELGKVSRWAEIYQLNREALGKDYDYLTPGMRLVLPSRESQSPDRTTRRPEDAQPLTR